MTEFKVGDTVEVLEDKANNSYWMKGEQFKVRHIGDNHCWGRKEGGYINRVDKKFLKLVKRKGNEKIMANSLTVNKTVAKVYKSIDDITLVSKHFPEIREDNILDELSLSYHFTEVLKRAKQKEKDETEKK